MFYKLHVKFSIYFLKGKLLKEALQHIPLVKIDINIARLHKRQISIMDNTRQQVQVQH